MICFPNAKINLGLAVTEKRADGFHNLETCFYPVPLCDALEFVEAREFKLRIFGNVIEGDLDDNLLSRVWHKLHAEFQIPSVQVALLKKIPSGAGLGGGSADAAFFLKGLNSYFSLGLSLKQMEDWILALGSDCPFFIRNKPVIGKGQGELMSEIDFSLSSKVLTLVFPFFSIPTARAFQQIVPRFPDRAIIDVLKLPIADWKGLLSNDFQRVAILQHMEIGVLIDKLYVAGASYVSLTGSGSAVYAISDEFLPKLSLPNQYAVYAWRL